MFRNGEVPSVQKAEREQDAAELRQYRGLGSGSGLPGTVMFPGSPESGATNRVIPKLPKAVASKLPLEGCLYRVRR